MSTGDGVDTGKLRALLEQAIALLGPVGPTQVTTGPATVIGVTSVPGPLANFGPSGNAIRVTLIGDDVVKRTFTFFHPEWTFVIGQRVNLTVKPAASVTEWDTLIHAESVGD